VTDKAVPKGTWVQIHQQILTPEQRAPQVPEDTAKVPLVMITKGFLENEGQMGQIVTVRTLCGRSIEGKLIKVLPRFAHDFGDAVPELLAIGPRVRALLEGGEKQ
jgi:hypothetical protein